jgi:hypothetical protein
MMGRCALPNTTTFCRHLKHPRKGPDYSIVLAYIISDAAHASAFTCRAVPWWE